MGAALVLILLLGTGSAAVEEPAGTAAEEEALRDAMRAQPMPSPYVQPMPRFPVEGVPPQGKPAGEPERRGRLTATQWVWLGALAATVLLLLVELRRHLDRR